MPVARLATLPGTYGRSLRVPVRASRRASVNGSRECDPNMGTPRFTQLAN